MKKLRHILQVMPLLLALAAGGALAAGYRSTITVNVENKSSFANRIQVRDVEARYGYPEDCRSARKVAASCGGDSRRELRRDAKMTCAAALALVDEPRCSVKDLIFDDWVDAGAVVPLTVFLGHEGYGLIAVRAVNNTESWTFKPGLRDGDTVGHQ